MDRQEIIEKIRGILIVELKLDEIEIHDELVAADVNGWDSLTHMVIITEIENKFDIKFRLKELNKLKNMGTLIELVSSKL